MSRLALLVPLAATAAGAWAACSGGALSARAAPAACPLRLPSSTASTRPGARLELVPGSPSALLLCGYHGLNPAGTAGRLERTRLVGAGAELDWLVREFDALRPSPPFISCPMDNGAGDLALFEYPTPPAAPVSVGLSGCRIVQNGHLTRTASLTPGPALLARLSALLG